MSELGYRIGVLLKQVQYQLRTRMDDALRQERITTPQYAALTALSEHPGLSGAEMARRCFVTPQTMNMIIRNLEDANLVERSASDVDQRVIVTRLTPAGAQKLKEADQRIATIERELVSLLTPSDEEALARFLQACLAGLAGTDD